MNNPQDFEFSVEEQLEISEAIEKMSILAKDELAMFQIFVEWINEWSKFVHQVEEGYMLNLDDFRNYISGRRGLTELIDAVSTDTKSKIVKIIIPLDNIYFNATVPLDKPKSGFYAVYGKWARRPKKLIGSLKSDFEKEDLM